MAENIKRIEKELWTNPIDQSVMVPYLRVSDNNNAILLTDLQKLHGITFSKSKKDKKRAALNALDVDILQERIIINPKCKHLVYHMNFAEWNNAETDFKKLKDSPTGKVRGGHADALAALMYLHRSVVKSHNPYPPGFGDLTGSNVFRGLRTHEPKTNELGNAIRQLFKKKH
jgi:hypothetical protein